MTITELLWLLTAIFSALLVLASAALLWVRWDRGLVRGWIGEQKTRWLHLGRLDSKIYKTQHDLLVPHNRRPSEMTQIDHVVASRYGVFVIETKYWGGLIYGKEHEKRWTLAFGRHTRHQPKNPLRQNHGHLMAVARYCGLQPDQVHSLVFLAGDGEPKTLSEMGPQVVHKSGLAERIESHRTLLLDEASLDRCVALLRKAKRETTPAKRRAHLATLRQRHGTN